MVLGSQETQTLCPWCNLLNIRINFTNKKLASRSLATDYMMRFPKFYNFYLRTGEVLMDFVLVTQNTRQKGLVHKQIERKRVISDD